MNDKVLIDLIEDAMQSEPYTTLRSTQQPEDQCVQESDEEATARQTRETEQEEGWKEETRRGEARGQETCGLSWEWSKTKRGGAWEDMMLRNQERRT